MKSRNTDDYRNSPVAWFVELESALDNSNYERAAEAQRELQRLGVRVAFQGVRARRLRAVASRLPASTLQHLAEAER